MLRISHGLGAKQPEPARLAKAMTTKPTPQGPRQSQPEPERPKFIHTFPRYVAEPYNPRPPGFNETAVKCRRNK